jgi:hypothetical protein
MMTLLPAPRILSTRCGVPINLNQPTNQFTMKNVGIYVGVE